MTAQRTSADTDSSQDLSLIPDTDLTQFNSGLKYGSQILYQLPEIYTSISSKIKQYLIIIKGILRINKLHLQVMSFNLLLEYLKFLLLIAPIVLLPVIILLCGQPDHILQRLNHLAFLHLFGSQN